MEKTRRQQKDHERYLRNRQLFLERARAWRLANPERDKEKTKRQWLAIKSDPTRYARYLDGRSVAQRRLKMRVLEHYCGGAPQCECCGADEIEFLSLDHINGGGNAHRRQVGANLYKWASRNNFPPDIFRVLCMNCNVSIGHYGYCPHSD